MTIQAPSPATSANDSGTGAEQPTSDAPELQSGPSPAGSMAVVPALAYSDFAGALKGALRDFHRPDLLARRWPIMIEPRERGRRKADHEHDHNQDERAKSEKVSADPIEVEAHRRSAPAH